MLQHFFRISESHLYRTVPAYNGDSNHLEFFRLQCQHDSQAVIDTRITVDDYFSFSIFSFPFSTIQKAKKYFCLQNPNKQK